MNLNVTIELVTSPSPDVIEHLGSILKRENVIPQKFAAKPSSSGDWCVLVSVSDVSEAEGDDLYRQLRDAHFVKSSDIEFRFISTRAMRRVPNKRD